MKIRKNITISDTMLVRGDDVAKARGFDDFSEMVSALIREEYERRGLSPAANSVAHLADQIVSDAATHVSAQSLIKPKPAAVSYGSKKRAPRRSNVKPAAKP